jgi:steroid 5-alpha reductase family enzyme
MDEKINTILNNYDYFYHISLFQIPYMTLAWLLCIFLRNGSFVDFAWPSGFIVMTVQIYFNSNGLFFRKMLICLPYIICGLRFNIGWVFGRKHYKKEDTRWDLWREKWRNGEGILGIKNISVNFFFFYHCQSFTNIFVLSIPLILACNNKSETISYLEYLGFLVWMISFILENLADHQLAEFKKQNKGKVMCYGLWKYSRHPNYFFEWMIWISYLIIAFDSIRNYEDAFYLLTVPFVAYYFLVEFTGVPMSEKAAEKRRGGDYVNYQKSTNMFFPWFPKNKIN